MDFADVNSLQTKLDDAEKQLATARLEIEQIKEKQKLETARLRKRWKEETEDLKAELQQANMDVEYLNRRLEEEKTRDTAALVSETVKATLEQFAHERTANAAAAIPPGPSTGVHFFPNKYQSEANQALGDFKTKASISGQRVPAVSSQIPPARPPSPNAMDWSPSGSHIEPSK
ncbi:hypothetical protein FS837_005266 [Tulasnella sp. UAMH 9824]|nr:hypothetical protein FS837_005266 [Tulasnella sp. UAMH 9824]